MKDKIIIGVLSGIIVGFLIAIATMALLNNKKESFDIGEAIKRENDYVVIKGNNTTTKVEDSNINVGDIVKRENNTTTIIKTTTTVTTTKVSEADVINTFASEYDSVSKKVGSVDFKESAKNLFIKIVDFIFYGTEINGVHFKDLTMKSKMAVIKYALLLDSKINSYFPDYKQELGEKYNLVKDKLISEYMNSLTYVCSKNKNECETVKHEFNDLKGKISITWSNLKDAFKNGADKTKTSLEEWYKIFKNN